MADARTQSKMIEQELARIRDEIARLRAQEEVLLGLQQKMSGKPADKAGRKRSGSIKPLVLDAMRNAGTAGATSAEVDEIVRQQVPTVAKDTVGSTLSRLKSEGALVYDGARYYEKRFAPKPNSPFEGGVRAVN